jgi:hypothetical protein
MNKKLLNSLIALAVIIGIGTTIISCKTPTNCEYSYKVGKVIATETLGIDPDSMYVYLDNGDKIVVRTMSLILGSEYKFVYEKCTYSNGDVATYYDHFEYIGTKP